MDWNEGADAAQHSRVCYEIACAIEAWGQETEKGRLPLVYYIADHLAKCGFLRSHKDMQRYLTELDHAQVCQLLKSGVRATLANPFGLDHSTVVR